MTLLFCPGPRVIPGRTLGFTAPPGLREITRITETGEPLFITQPRPRVTMAYRTATGPGSQVSPLQPVSMLAGKVIVWLGRWVEGEVRE